MAYHINEITVKAFIEDTTIKLPRFQRRQAWDVKKDFGLCVSMFKGYPLGVVIYNQTKVGPRIVNYLLDGRQRRSALKNLIENPTRLYQAAIKYLGVKANASDAELDEAYWKKIGIYLNQSTDNSAPLENDEDETDSDIDADTQKGNLKLLLEYLHLLHGNSKKDVTALEKRWSFGKYFNWLPYFDSGTQIVDPKKLKKFIVADLAAKFSENEQFTEDALYNYLTKDFGFIQPQASAFKKKLSEVFESLKKDFDVLVRVQTSVFEQANIGVIKIMKVSSLDSQNIFSLVNKGGTPLKAEELLSAKPFWNTSIASKDLDVPVMNSIAELYRRLNIPGENDPHNGMFVYWDLCATFIDRIDKHHLVFQEYADDDSGLLLKVQHGFKTVAALLEDGISAVKIEALEQETNLVQSLSHLQQETNRMLSILLGNAFFKSLLSWGRSLTSLVGIAPSLEFLAILRKFWEQLETKPGDYEKKFVRGAICLLDRLILEHARGEWKGSSDSKMSKHLKGNWTERVELLKRNEWEEYLAKACGPTMEDYKKQRAVLYYFAILQGKSPDNVAEIEYDIDHIIPQKEFDQLVEGIGVDKGLMDSLGNVSLLPRKKNESKGEKKLNELSDDLKSLVAKYADIDISDFGKYSNVKNIAELVEERKAVFMDVLGKREQVVLS